MVMTGASRFEQFGIFLLLELGLQFFLDVPAAADNEIHSEFQRQFHGGFFGDLVVDRDNRAAFEQHADQIPRRAAHRFGEAANRNRQLDLRLGVVDNRAFTAFSFLANPLAGRLLHDIILKAASPAALLGLGFALGLGFIQFPVFVDALLQIRRARPTGLAGFFLLAAFFNVPFVLLAQRGIVFEHVPGQFEVGFLRGGFFDDFGFFGFRSRDAGRLREKRHRGLGRLFQRLGFAALLVGDVGPGLHFHVADEFARNAPRSDVILRTVRRGRLVGEGRGFGFARLFQGSFGHFRGRWKFHSRGGFFDFGDGVFDHFRRDFGFLRLFVRRQRRFLGGHHGDDFIRRFDHFDGVLGNVQFRLRGLQVDFRFDCGGSRTAGAGHPRALGPTQNFDLADFSARIERRVAHRSDGALRFRGLRLSPLLDVAQHHIPLLRGNAGQSRVFRLDACLVAVLNQLFAFDSQFFRQRENPDSQMRLPGS